MEIKDRMSKIEELENFDVPWEVAHIFGKVRLFGSQICIGEEGDYVSLEEFQEALTWLVRESGGKVTWQKKKT